MNGLYGQIKHLNHSQLFYIEDKAASYILGTQQFGCSPHELITSWLHGEYKT